MPCKCWQRSNKGSPPILCPSASPREQPGTPQAHCSLTRPSRPPVCPPAWSLGSRHSALSAPAMHTRLTAPSGLCLCCSLCLACCSLDFQQAGSRLLTIQVATKGPGDDPSRPQAHPCFVLLSLGLYHGPSASNSFLSLGSMQGHRQAQLAHRGEQEPGLTPTCVQRPLKPCEHSLCWPTVRACHRSVTTGGCRRQSKESLLGRRGDGGSTKQGREAQAIAREGLSRGQLLPESYSRARGWVQHRGKGILAPGY